MATGRQIERAGRLAKELYENDPQALGNAALYAFGLHLQGDTEKGADLLDSRQDLDQLGSDGAAYCALVFSACGKGDKARQLLATVDREILLPELRASLDRVFGTAARAPRPFLRNETRARNPHFPRNMSRQAAQASNVHPGADSRRGGTARCFAKRRAMLHLESGFHTRRNPSSSKSLVFTVANSVTPWAVMVRVERVS